MNTMNQPFADLHSKISIVRPNPVKVYTFHQNSVHITKSQNSDKSHIH